MPNSDSPDISFIVPVHNRLDCTETFVPSLLQTASSQNFELILVNDKSEDSTREFLDGLTDPRIKVIHNDTWSGYAISVNRGVQESRGNILGLLNNDLGLTEGWLEPMLECYNERLRVGTIGNIQRNIETKRIDHAGIIFDLLGLPDHYGKNYPFIFPFDYKEFPAVTAACMLIKRDLFNEMNGFDESYLNGCEDVDLCLRLREKGYRNFVSGRSQIFHHVSASPGRRDNDTLNNQKLLKTWGKSMQRHGQRNWPFQYLMRYWKSPWLYNGTKFLDAIFRIMRLKSGDSQWAKEKRKKILNTPSK
ncbi:glycosyltransferase [Opitutales bacterium]|nr:glycosyltransferase [Opitutales bacterium]